MHKRGLDEVIETKLSFNFSGGNFSVMFWNYNSHRVLTIYFDFFRFLLSFGFN